MSNTIQELKEHARKDLALKKANILVQDKKVRRSPCVEFRNIWMVGSYSTPKKWYVVKYDEDIGFVCGCKSYEFSHDNVCLHILACAIFESGGPL